ncbi:MAG TPA: preprotein translocase subunit YajC [Acidimicrobiales bacterium]|nr:preprotein translocase subunit YajC [Acidimicrobiales bacterium]
MLQLGSNVVLLAATTSSTKKPTSSSYGFLIALVAIFGVVYFLFLRPRTQAARKAREQTSQITVGDEIVTIGGIVGRVVEMEGDRVTIETGSAVEGYTGSDLEPTRLVMLRQAIARKAPPPPSAVADEAEDWHEDHEEEDHEDHDEHEADEAHEDTEDDGPDQRRKR